MAMAVNEPRNERLARDIDTLCIGGDGRVIGAADGHNFAIHTYHDPVLDCGRAGAVNYTAPNEGNSA